MGNCVFDHYSGVCCVTMHSFRPLLGEVLFFASRLAFFRAAARVYFLLRAQEKVTKREGHPDGLPLRGALCSSPFCARA